MAVGLTGAASPLGWPRPTEVARLRLQGSNDAICDYARRSYGVPTAARWFLKAVAAHSS